MKNKTLPISQLGCLLNGCRETVVYSTNILIQDTLARFRKDPMVHAQDLLSNFTVCGLQI